MPQQCKVCSHPARKVIDAALVEGRSVRELESIHNVSAGSLRRHAENHLPRAMVKAQAAADVVAGETLLAKVAGLEVEAHRLKDQAEEGGDIRTALVAVRELCRIVELQGRLLGELREQQVVNVLINPEWIAIRAELVAALAPYPAAQQAVSSALLRLDA